MYKHLFKATLGLMGIMGTLAMGVVSAETTVTHYTGSNISYVLNSGFDTQKTFTGVGTITITDCDGTNADTCTTITILDRNLGATKAGTGCDYNTNGNAYCAYDDTYGYHFQRGNNYGFKPGCDLQGSTALCADPITSNASPGQVNASTIEYNPSNQQYYISGVFYKGNANRLNNNSKVDLWGGGTSDSTDTTYNVNDDTWKVNEDTVTSRQGPCPEGFHIPSKGELDKLKNMMGNSVSNIHTKLLMPFAGGRFAIDAHVYYMGYFGELWSSSPHAASSSLSRYFYLHFDGTNMNSNKRSYAPSIRCFYDFYQPYIQSFTFSFTASEGGSISTGSIEVKEGSSISRSDEIGSVTISGIVVATGIADEGYVFSGWLTDCVGDTVTRGCNFTGEFKPITYIITYLGTGDNYIPSATGYTIESDVITLAQPSKDGYTFTGWSGTYLTLLTQTVEIPAGSTGDRIYEANREANMYTITYEVDGGVNSPNNVTGYTIESNITFENPTKDGYSFDGWFTDAQFMTGITTIPVGTTGDITIYAKWTENKKPSGGSSGGGGRNTSKSEDKQKEDKTSTDTDNVIQNETEGSEKNGNTYIDSSDNSSEGQQFTEEFQQAYEFAHDKGITTMSTIQKADMNGKLTRIAMAKMLSYYAINVLGQKPDETRNNKFNDISDELDAQYDNGVTLAYQLGIMGINMLNNNFRPNDEVTRAEFGTALSRMLYSTPDGKPYYATHLEKLKAEGILTNDDAKMKELRGYVMIMLMRSAK